MGCCRIRVAQSSVKFSGIHWWWSLYLVYTCQHVQGRLKWLHLWRETFRKVFWGTPRKGSRLEKKTFISKIEKFSQFVHNLVVASKSAEPAFHSWSIKCPSLNYRKNPIAEILPVVGKRWSYNSSSSEIYFSASILLYCHFSCHHLLVFHWLVKSQTFYYDP